MPSDQTVQIDAPTPPPELRPITEDTIKAALRQGFADFKAAPAYGLFFGAVYFLGGILMWGLATYTGHAFYLILAAFAFPLIGPFAAIGLYEVSRRLQEGEELDWGGVLGVVFAQKDRQIPFLGAVIVFLVMIWVLLSRITVALFLGNERIVNLFSSADVLFTLNGFAMLAVIGIVGFSVAFLILSISVIGMPLLLDREMDFVTAMITSFEVVTENLKPMLMWAGIVVAFLVIGMLPAFLGLLVVLPILGHATWHIYKAAVE
ncbi:MAG: DUF2189 domain-containing protein [Rhodobacteraceae bacterium]|nr:DUF2189 domain-containing protein [Paracoccaceae bacterium]